MNLTNDIYIVVARGLFECRENYFYTNSKKEAEELCKQLTALNTHRYAKVECARNIEKVNATITLEGQIQHEKIKIGPRIRLEIVEEYDKKSPYRIKVLGRQEDNYFLSLKYTDRLKYILKFKNIMANIFHKYISDKEWQKNNLK